MRTRVFPHPTAAALLAALLGGGTLGCDGRSPSEIDPNAEQHESLDGVQDDRNWRLRLEKERRREEERRRQDRRLR